jgi:hypothetical protein
MFFDSPNCVMPRFHLKESNRHLTSTAGLMLIGHCLVLAELERLDLRWPKRGKIRLSDRVKSYVGLLTLGQSDFEAMEAFRRYRFFEEAMSIGQVPGSGGCGSSWRHMRRCCGSTRTRGACG